jgi:hypothetical protein
MSFCWLWSLVFKSFTWCLISHSSVKFQSHFSSLSSATALLFSFVNISICSLKLKDVSTLSHDSAIGLSHGTIRPHIQHQFPGEKKRLKQAMRLNEVQSRHHNFRNMFKLQSRHHNFRNMFKLQSRHHNFRNMFKLQSFSTNCWWMMQW